VRGWANRRPEERPPAQAGAPDEEEPLRTEARPAIPWPDRALAAVAAAAVAAWLAGVVLAPSPIPLPVAALIGGVAVAALPRIGWVALILAAGTGLAAQGHPGATLVFVVAALLPAVLLPLHPARWPLGAFAPVLGTIGLAGAWPALAARGAWSMAAGGAGRERLGDAGGGRGPRRQRSLRQASARGCRAFGVDALALADLPPRDHSAGQRGDTGARAGLGRPPPPYSRGRRSCDPLPVQVVLVTIWTAATASATTVLLHAGHAGTLLTPGAAVLGAVAAGLVALAPALAGTIRGSRRADNTPMRLA